MPQPAALAPDETAQERRSRQLAFLRELAELNMQTARAAAARVEQADPETDQADAATLSLARATRAVTTIFNIENRIADGENQAQFRPHDPRSALLREALHPLTKSEPDSARRTALRRRIDQAIDDAILTDPDEDLSPVAIATVIAKSVGLKLDLAKVSDAFLGMPPRPRRPPDSFDHSFDLKDDDPDLPLNR